MKFTVDTLKPFTLGSKQEWYASHYAIIKMLGELGIFCETRESKGHSMLVDFDVPVLYPRNSDAEISEILLMRLALGDDIKRIRMDATKYFLDVKIEQYLSDEKVKQ